MKQKPQERPLNQIDANSIINRLEDYSPKTAAHYRNLLNQGTHHPSQVVRLIVSKILCSKDSVTITLP